ncbi:MAG: 3'-5' exonuclease, partial [Trueperaceae bacterium]|nr:3'-5' exonuclease [Trueperaceae bacterium]
MSAPRYARWSDVPHGLKPENDLRFAGLEPRGEPAGWLDLDGRSVALFREADATPRAPAAPPRAPGSIDPSRSNDRPAGSAGTRAAGARRDVVALPGRGSLHRAAVRTDADPASGIAAGRSWIRALLLDDFVVLDTETTGLGYADEVIEVGVVGPDGGVLLESLVRPRSGVVPPGASRVHGLTMDDLHDAPTFDEVYGTLLEVAAGRRVIAWNAPFDERMVRQSATAWGRRERLRGFECAMRAYALARGLRHGRAKLERAATETGVLGAGPQTHRSTDDARLTLQV